MNIAWCGGEWLLLLTGPVFVQGRLQIGQVGDRSWGLREPHISHSKERRGHLIFQKGNTLVIGGFPCHN